MVHSKKIAYLAPEIPALSATFIYNEILYLEKNGFVIVPISVHYPSSPATGNELITLFEKTYFLYNIFFLTFIFAAIRVLIKNPLRYLHALMVAIKDSLKIGIFSHIGIGILYRFIVASRLSEIITQNGCSHLHSHFAHIPTDIAMYASQISDIPFSFTSHANDLFERGWLLKEKVERSKFAITISEHNRRFLIGLGAQENKIHVIHCGVDFDSFHSEIRESINKIPIIGSLGRMVEKKGFDTLIDACEILKQNKQPFRLEIAGSGPLYDDLQRQINTKNLTEEVSLIGALPHDKIPGWLKDKDIFVLPCKRDKQGDMDGIPVVLMEAMAIGVPVVSSKISGIPELVEDHVSGLLINEGDSEALSVSILDILNDKNFRISLIKNAINKVKHEFELSKNANRLSNLFIE
jgi:colanic acid/amylovoran biosynthesis glycosyltransferase